MTDGTRCKKGRGALFVCGIAVALATLCLLAGVIFTACAREKSGSIAIYARLFDLPLSKVSFESSFSNVWSPKDLQTERVREKLRGAPIKVDVIRKNSGKMRQVWAVRSKWPVMQRDKTESVRIYRFDELMPSSVGGKPAYWCFTESELGNVPSRTRIRGTLLDVNDKAIKQHEGVYILPGGNAEFEVALQGGLTELAITLGRSVSKAIISRVVLKMDDSMEIPLQTRFNDKGAPQFFARAIMPKGKTRFTIYHTPPRTKDRDIPEIFISEIDISFDAGLIFLDRPLETGVLDKAGYDVEYFTYKRSDVRLLKLVSESSDSVFLAHDESNHSLKTTCTVEGDCRRAYKLFVPASASFETQIPEKGVLAFALSAAAADDGFSSAFSVLFDAEGGNEIELMKAKASEKDAWREYRLDLSKLAGKKGKIVFRTSAGSGAGVLYIGEPILWGAAGKKAPLPNIVFVMQDSLRADHLGCYGYRKNRTSPLLDLFAERSIRFNNMFSTTSWTRPSLASVFTGCYDAAHGAHEIDGSIARGLPLVARFLREKGYLTCGFVENPNVAAVWGFSSGFDEYKQLWLGDHSFFGTVGYAPKIVPWAEANKNAPFFLYIHDDTTHIPYIPLNMELVNSFDPGYKGPINGSLEQIVAFIEGRMRFTPADVRHLIALYDACIRTFDDNLHNFLQSLEELGLDENTIIIVASDHGEEFTEHGSLGHGLALYRELLHVPLIIYIPPQYKTGGPKVVSEFMELPDLFPTLFGILGFDGWPTTHGRDFSKAVLGENATARRYCRASLDRRDVHWNVPLKGLSVLDAKNHYIHFQRDNATTEIFYNLIRDPLERTNLLPEYPSGRVDPYRAEMRSFEKENQPLAHAKTRRETSPSRETMEELRKLGYIASGPEKVVKPPQKGN